MELHPRSPQGALLCLGEPPLHSGEGRVSKLPQPADDLPCRGALQLHDDRPGPDAGTQELHRHAERLPPVAEGQRLEEGQHLLRRRGNGGGDRFRRAQIDPAGVHLPGEPRMEAAEPLHQRRGIGVIPQSRQKLPPPLIAVGSTLNDGTNAAHLGEAIPSGAILRRQGEDHRAVIPVHLQDGEGPLRIGLPERSVAKAPDDLTEITDNHRSDRRILPGWHQRWGRKEIVRPVGICPFEQGVAGKMTHATLQLGCVGWGRLQRSRITRTLTTRGRDHTMPAMSGFVSLRAALVGCGTVGGATAQLLVRNRESIAARSGIDIELAAIVDREFDHARSLGLPEELFQTDLDAVLAEPGITVVIELVGGLTFARDLIMRSLDAGKHVVTANKALLAHHGAELFAYARERGLTIGFEASCGGGIPIIRAITDGLIANTIDAIYGIVNGTSNFLLTEMIQQGKTYQEALAAAQTAGLAEADPSLDVNGTDSAHKIAIMTALAFGTDVDFDAIPVEGIDHLDARDVAFGAELGYVVKLLAVAHRIGSDVTAWVRPAFISRAHPLAWVNGPFNAVSVYGSATGHTLYYGRGAGGAPTASAVVADVAGIASGILPAVFAHTRYWPDRNQAGPQVGLERSTSRFYLRIMARDQPGVLAAVSEILGNHGISIASLRQNERAPQDAFVPVVVTTHACGEPAIREAVRLIDGLEAISEGTVCMPIVEEHPEDLAD
jgi:homoserine dehydrogenase